jgi:MFS family permease
MSFRKSYFGLAHWKELILLAPSYYIWTATGLFVLIYLFDLVKYVEQNNLALMNDPSFLLVLWGFPAALTVSFTGMYIDYNPRHLKNLIFISLLGSSTSLLLNMIALIIENSILLIVTLILLGFFTGITIISGQILYGVFDHWKTRGRTYSLIMFAFGVSSLLPILISSTFFFPLLLISVLGILLSFIFYRMTKNMDISWKKEERSTKLTTILTRPSIVAYFWTHTLIWIMLGLMIGSLATIGDAYFTNFDHYKGFWAIVLFGSAITILPSGYLADRLGRKTLIILATNGVVLSALILGVFNDQLTFYLSAFFIGVSFALVHTTLDSSLWVDLASKDSIGRYSSLNFQSLGLGFVIGFVVSYWGYLFLFPEFLGINIFILIGLAVFASLPLFWTNDSFPPLEFFLLLVIKSGIPLFHYNFGKDKELQVDLPLISGALSAVGSFMHEATGEKDAHLSLVRHGTHFIISDENEMGLVATIFSNKNDPELQKLLKKFLILFQIKYRDEIQNWDGNLNVFSEAVNDAVDIFGHLITIKTERLIGDLSEI